LPGHWETEKAYAAAQARLILPCHIRKPEDLRTFYSPRKMRAQNIILMCIIRGSFEFLQNCRFTFL
jgi:hypothetical protein